MSFFIFVIILVTCSSWSHSKIRAKQTQSLDISLSPSVFETNALPINDSHMATIGNGHVATVVYSDTVFMNGLYNGFRGESHRARIPSRINVRMSLPAKRTILERNFRLDVRKGTFTEHLLTDDVLIEQITYAHRSHKCLLITQFRATFTSNNTSITLALTNNIGAESSDIKFYKCAHEKANVEKCLQGYTKILEDPAYQSEPTPVVVIWNVVPQYLVLNATHPERTFIMAVGENWRTTYGDFSEATDTILAKGHSELLSTHIQGWNMLWESGNIHLHGTNLELMKTVYGSVYYLLSSLPSRKNQESRKPFYGMSPGGLAHGSMFQDYQGHTFWDTEMWMFPPIVLLWQDSAKDLLLYRMANIQPARKQAEDGGYRGARFPWESAYTGVDVTPECCPETKEFQQHITGDIAFAARQYWAASMDYKWLKGEDLGFPLEVNGCKFIRDLAEFWVTRAELNTETGQYEINGVMPPDEDHHFVNNSVYTNVVASYSIFFAKYASCVCNDSTMDGVPEDWLNVARRMKYLFDEQHKYHPEYDGYEAGETIKQADVVLLGYPLMHVQDHEVRRRDLEIYGNVTRQDGPAMTWSMHAISYLEIGEEEKAELYFNRSYRPYKIEPFKIWSESENQKGAVNCITGMGGFLQALLFGYAGFRLKLDSLSGNPRLPPGVDNMTIQGVDYTGCVLDFIITNDNMTITPSFACNLSLETYDEYKNSMFHAMPAVLPRQYFVIRPSSLPSCPLPEDKLGQNKGFMGWKSELHSLRSFIAALLVYYTTNLSFQKL